MADFRVLLPIAVAEQEAFILDHGKKVDGVLKYKDDLTSYGWNIRQFNKMKVGAFVLNRRPGKLTKDRKFEIYAGGYVESISEPDSEGNVIAVISHAFNIVPPIRQGDTFLESFEWNSKNKKPNTWEHFWNQYGMNAISYTDYSNLLANANCVPVKAEVIVEENDISESDIEELQKDAASGFNVIFEEEGATHNKKEKKYTGIAKKTDYDKLQKAKNKIGILGEDIVMGILTREAEASGLKAPFHASKEEGDGLGYDIRAWDKNGKEVHIEVKASKDNYADGFEMSYNEVAASLDTNYKYLIYRIYGLNTKTKECKVKVYEGPVNDANFKLVSTKVAVYQK